MYRRLLVACCLPKRYSTSWTRQTRRKVIARKCWFSALGFAETCQICRLPEPWKQSSYFRHRRELHGALFRFRAGLTLTSICGFDSSCFLVSLAGRFSSHSKSACVFPISKARFHRRASATHLWEVDPWQLQFQRKSGQFIFRCKNLG